MNSLYWYQNNIEPEIVDCQIERKYYPTGDFGSLDQVRINSSKLEIQLDFWGMGWLGVYVFDTVKETELLNVLSNSDEKAQQKESLETLSIIIKEYR